jgi:hypothetical protein
VVVASAARLQEAAAEGHCLPASGEEPASLKFPSDWGADAVAQVGRCGQRCLSRAAARVPPLPWAGPKQPG